MRTLGLRGSELAHSDNPSVMALRETAMTAPFTQGSRGCSRTSGFFDGSRKYQGIAMPVRALAPIEMRIWPWAGADRRNTRRNWKRFSEVPKMGCRGLWKKRKIISCVKKGLIS